MLARHGLVDASRMTGTTAAGSPRALPFTGADTMLLLELSALLLLAGGGVLVATRRKDAARVRLSSS